MLIRRPPNRFFPFRLTAALSAAALAACGGGGGGGSSPPPPPPPPVNAAPTFTSAGNASAAENGNASGYTATATDADGDTLTFSISGGADAALFSIDGASGLLSFNAPPNFEIPGDSNADNVYDVTIGVSDGNGGTATQAVAVTVTDVAEPPPVFSSAATASVPENDGGNVYTAVAAGSGPISYEITGGADQAQFTIDAASGELSFVSNPDFENPADAGADNNYEVTINADDAGLLAELAVTITVTDQKLYTAILEYPTGGANLGGRTTQARVSARVLDADDGSGASGVLTSILIDGVAPIQDPNDPDRFTTDVPVAFPVDNIDVNAQFADGSASNTANAIGNQPIIEEPEGVLYDADNNALYYVEPAINAVIEVTADGNRIIRSGAGVGSGTEFRSVADMVADFPANRTNPNDDFVLVLDATVPAIHRVQLTTGDRTRLWSCCGLGSPGIARAFAVTADRATAYVTATYPGASNFAGVFAVDLVNGTSTVASSSTFNQEVGTGAELFSPNGIALDEANNRLFVYSNGIDRVLEIDIATGNRTEVSGDAVGSGPTLSNLSGIAFDSGNDRLIASDQGPTANSVLSIQLATGDRTEISGFVTGSGPPLASPLSIAYVPADNLAFVSTRFVGPSIQSVDLATGDRTLISESFVGMGDKFFALTSLAYDAAARELRVLDAPNLRVSTVDLGSGDRRVLSDSQTGSGTDFSSSVVSVITGRSTNETLVFDRTENRLIAVDNTTGDRTVTASDTVGSGPAFDTVVAMTFDAGNNRALLVDSVNNSVFAIDLATGDRSTVSDASSGTSFITPTGIVVDPAGDRAFITDQTRGTVIEVDLLSGTRADFANVMTDCCAATGRPQEIRLDGDRLLVLEGEEEDLLAFDLATATQSLVSSGESSPGPVLRDLTGLALDVAGRRAFVGDGAMDAIIVIDLETGEKAITSL